MHVHAHTPSQPPPPSYHHHLWKMSTVDPCNSLHVSSPLFKCLASILEHKKNTPSNLDNDRENNSESLSSKLHYIYYGGFRR